MAVTTPGARATGGPVEKDYVLQFARRLRATIESRIGVRVLSRAMPMRIRTSIAAPRSANNNKADLFISLHANASVRATTRGAQVLSQRLEDYRTRISASTFTELARARGGWRHARHRTWCRGSGAVPFATKSSALALSIARQFSDRGVAMYARPTAQLPLRTLVGANMPAVLIELGFLTNADDARALAGTKPQPQ
jgi:N-acetylmuramoyl-L-alanine amidase